MMSQEVPGRPEQQPTGLKMENIKTLNKRQKCLNAIFTWQNLCFIVALQLQELLGNV